MIRRRTTMRWGYRLGTSLAYFTDPDLGEQRRHEVLARLESIGGRSRFGPMIAWLQELNQGRIGPPPSRGSFEEADEAPTRSSEAAGEAQPDRGLSNGDASVGTDGEDRTRATIEDLTIIEHHQQDA